LAGRCVEKIGHSCGTSDGCQVFEDDGQYSAYCFACSTYIKSPYGSGENAPQRKVRLTKTPEEVTSELAEIHSLKSIELEDRKLLADTLNHYGVKVSVSEQDGVTPNIQYCPHTSEGVVVGYQARLLEDKKFWWIGETNDVDLFGWEQARKSPSKTLFITEGANDALALYQVLTQRNRGTQFEGFSPAVCSVTHGASGARRDISRQLDAIKSKFENVVLVFDDDAPGQAAVQSVLQVLPTAKAAKCPSKDPNAALIEGRSNALATAVLFEAKTPKSTRLISASSLYEAAKEPAQWGLSWPWPKLTRLTRGIRYGETIYIGAGVKMGKGELRNAITSHLICEHGLKTFVVSPEEHNKGTVQRVLGKVAGRIFHDPSVEFDFAAYDDAAAKVGDKLCMLDLWQQMDWEHLKSDIRVAAVEGCKAVFIDPITNLVAGNASGDVNTMLEQIAQELSVLAKTLNIVIFIFCHLKSPQSGPPHENGGEVLSAQFAGSRAMMRSCNLMLGLWGNKHPDLPEDRRNIRHVVILEDREFGASGKVPLFWDMQTGLFNPMEEER
jgi:twinkle protein